MTSKKDVIKTETIDNQNKPDTEYITPEYIETPNYDYGFSQERLDYNKAIRNKPTTATGFKVKIGGGTITGSGTLAITGVGFQPKLVEIVCNNGANGICTGYGDDTSQFVNYMDDGNGAGNSTTLIIWYRNGGATICQASLTSLDTDGFTLNVSSFSSNTNYRYVCYG